MNCYQVKAACVQSPTNSHVKIFLVHGRKEVHGISSNRFVNLKLIGKVYSSEVHCISSRLDNFSYIANSNWLCCSMRDTRQSMPKHFSKRLWEKNVIFRDPQGKTSLNYATEKSQKSNLEFVLQLYFINNVKFQSQYSVFICRYAPSRVTFCDTFQCHIIWVNKDFRDFLISIFILINNNSHHFLWATEHRQPRFQFLLLKISLSFVVVVVKW